MKKTTMRICLDKRTDASAWFISRVEEFEKYWVNANMFKQIQEKALECRSTWNHSPFPPSWETVSKHLPSIRVLKLDLVVLDDSVRLLLIHVFALAVVGVAFGFRHRGGLFFFNGRHVCSDGDATCKGCSHIKDSSRGGKYKYLLQGKIVRLEVSMEASQDQNEDSPRPGKQNAQEPPRQDIHMPSYQPVNTPQSGSPSLSLFPQT